MILFFSEQWVIPMMSTTGSDVTSSAGNAVPEKVTLGVPTGRIALGEGTNGPNGELVGVSLQNSFKRMFQKLCSGRPRQDYRDYRPPPRDRGYSPTREGPPMKRMRGDGWGDDARPRFGGRLRGFLIVVVSYVNSNINLLIFDTP